MQENVGTKVEVEVEEGLAYRRMVIVGSPPNTSTSARVCRVPVYSWMVVVY